MAGVYGIDIGTSNFKMFSKDKDKILNEKNIIAIANKTEIFAFGDEAFEMYEKAPDNIVVSYPVKFGVIADIENMQTLRSRVRARSLRVLRSSILRFRQILLKLRSVHSMR